MSRSKWKGPYINRYKYYENNLLNKNITITPINLNSLLNIHNGFKKIKLKIDKEMVGKKIGEFIPTRKTCYLKSNLLWDRR